MKMHAKCYTTSINGIDLYYEIQGHGEPLLLLQGFTGSSADWSKVASNLDSYFQLIIPDLRGHGRSTNPLSVFTFQQVALDLYALLNHLNIRKIKGIGCSGGGNALLHLALQQPNLVEAMVLVSSTSYYPEQARSIMEKTSIDGLSQRQWQELRQKHFYGDSQIVQLYENARAFAEDNIDMNITEKNLGTITARTLIVQGDRDFLYPIDIAVEM